MSFRIRLTKEGQQVHDAEEGHDVKVDIPHEATLRGMSRADNLVVIDAVAVCGWGIGTVERAASDVDLLTVDTHFDDCRCEIEVEVPTKFHDRPRNARAQAGKERGRGVVRSGEEHRTEGKSSGKEVTTDSLAEDGVTILFVSAATHQLQAEKLRARGEKNDRIEWPVHESRAH